MMTRPPHASSRSCARGGAPAWEHQHATIL